MTMQPAHVQGFVPEWTFADRLRKARLTSELTQEEFAERLGAKSGAYAHWETGRNTPRQVVTIAQRIEMLTGVSATWLLGLADAAPGPNGGGYTADGGANPRALD